MAQLYLARHAQTTWNLAGRYQGREESALSALGVRQGLALADYFGAKVSAGAATPQRVVSSPLLRCAATAAFSAGRLGLPVHTDVRLIEIAHGTWDGRYRDEIAANDAQRYRAWREDPARVTFEGGERLGDVLARWRAFAAEAAHWTRDALVVTHDAVVRCALVDARGGTLDDFWKVSVENAAFARFETGAGLVLREECVTAHLHRLRADTSTQAL